MRWLDHSMLVLLALGGAAPAQAAMRADPADGRLMPPERVAPHIWVMRQPDRLWAAVIGNVEIIEQSDGVVLMDSGGSIADGRDVVDAVRRLTPKPIKAVGITHWHNDYPLGVPDILAAFPKARIVASPATAGYLKTELKTGVGKPDPALDAARRKIAADTIKALTEEAEKPSNDAAMRAQYAIEARWIATRLERQMGNYVVLPTETVAERLVIDDPVTRPALCRHADMVDARHRGEGQGRRRLGPDQGAGVRRVRPEGAAGALRREGFMDPPVAH